MWLRLLLDAAWASFVLFWLVTAFSASRAVKRQSWGSRMITLLWGALPYYLLFTNQLRLGALGQRFVPNEAWLRVIGVALTYSGLGLAVWARIVLGKNWSAAVTIKVDHQLVQRGPYAIVRHPIYSGLVLALLGSALFIGEVRGLLAVALAFAGWLVKSRTEERFMLERFGAEYEHYQQRTRALVPFIL
jgi:protein-S-isoprenylcysteine O-methyltransferase Ste14